MRYLNAILLASSLVALPIHAQSLKDIYNLAKQNDLLLKQQETQSKLAELQISSARAFLLPQVGTSANYSQSYGRIEQPLFVPDASGQPIISGSEYIKETTKGIGAEIQMAMPIYSHALWLNLDLAEKASLQAMLAYQATEQQLMFRVINQYLMVTKAQDSYELLDEQSRELKLLIEKVSDSNSNAYLDLMGRYTEISAQKVSQRAAWQASLAQLSILTGEVHQSIQSLDTSQIYSSEIDFPLEQAQLLAQQENRDYIARKMSVDIAKEQIEIAASAHLPSIAGSIGWTYRQELDSELSRVGVSGVVSISLPIYTGGAISTTVEIAKQSYIAASDELAFVFRELISATTIAYDAVNANAEVISVYQDSAKIAQQAFEATVLATKTGSRNSADVVSKLDLYYGNQWQLLSSQYDYLMSTISLRLLMGSLSEQDVLDIDSSLRQEI